MNSKKATRASLVDESPFAAREAVSEEAFRALAENAPDVLFRVRMLPEPQFVFVSPSVFALSGYAPEDFYAEPALFDSIVHEDDLERVLLARLALDTQGTLTVRIVHRDGRLIWTEHHVRATRGADGRLETVDGIVRDVTDSVRFSQELRRSEERFRGLTENASDVVFRVRTGPPPVIEYVSPSVFNLTGYTPADHDADPSVGLRHVHPDDRAKLAALTSPLSESISGALTLLRWLHRDGRTLWTEHRVRPIRDPLGQVVAVEGTLRDVTQTVQAHEKLSASEQLARSFVDAIPRAIAMLDAQGRVIATNRNWRACADAGPGASVWSDGAQYIDELKRHARELDPGLEAQVQSLLAGHTDRIDSQFVLGEEPAPRWISLQIRRFDGPGVGRAVVLIEDITARRREAQQLQLLSSVVQHTDDAVLVTDADGAVQYANPAHLKMTGYSLEELRARTPAPRAQTAELDSATGSEPVRVVSHEHAKDGTELHLDQTITPIRQPDGRLTHFVATGRDISARLQAEEKRCQTEARYQMLLELSSDVLSVIDATGRSMYLSPSSRRVFGYASEQRLGRSAFEFVHPDDVREVKLGFEGLLRHPRELQVVTYRYRRGDGSWRRFETTGRNHLADPTIAGIVLNTRDVTEQHEAKEAKARSEASFRTLIEHFPDAVAVFRNLAIVYANPAFAALLGCTQEQAIGRTVDDFELPEDLPETHERVQRLESLGGSLPVRESRCIRADGSKVLVEWHSLSITFDGLPSILSIARDVTEHRLMQTRLVLADRMVSVGTLAAGIAHEINNPLAYVTVNVAFASEQLSRLAEPALDAAAPHRFDLTEVREALSEAQDGTRRVQQIVRDLRTFSRGDEDRRGPVDLRRVLESCINMAWNEIRHRARLEKHFEDVPPVEANESRLGQVFLNLIINAAQAIEEGDAKNHFIRISTSRVGDRVAIEVRDSGAGIPAKIISRIFDPFFTTKAVGVGTGLGLSICHSIVTQHAGSISVTSEEGRGSTFRVELPISQQTPRIVDAAAAPQSTRRGRVMLVDDEDFVGAALQRLLKPWHDVELMSDARAALDRLLVSPLYDVVLCDLMMPDMTGMELYAAVQKRRPELAARFIFMTGGAFTPAARAFIEGVQNPQLEKPFDNATLCRLVQEAVDASQRPTAHPIR